MIETRIVRSLGIERPGRCAFFEYEERELSDGEYRVETLFTGLSAGTELTFFKGTNPYLHAHWDPDYGLFRNGEPGQRYPVRFLGYMEVARITDSRSPLHRPGELLGMAYGHKSGHTAAADQFSVPLPDDIDPLLGIYIAQMGPICANGLLHAAVDEMGREVQSLGDGVRDKNVLITGAGVVGLLTGLFALAHDARNVAVADPTPFRLRAAEALGMIPIDETRLQAWEYCKESWDDGHGERGADIVFQCRARSRSLNTALKSLRPDGAVIDLAFYQGGAEELLLGEEFHHNGLRIRCAQIGHLPRALAPRWDRGRLAHETCELLRTYGSGIREELISDIVPIDQAPRFIADLAEHRVNAIQAVFEMPAAAHTRARSAVVEERHA